MLLSDPVHMALLDGQCYVVLRATGAVRDAYAQVQGQVREKLAGLEVSYPAEPHVTLAGFDRETPLAAVRELVMEWARSVPPLQLDVKRVSVFPTPFQIVIVEIRRTPDLLHALTTLREGAQRRKLNDLATIAPGDWVFHLSVAYCSSLNATLWNDVAHWAATLAVPAAQTVVLEAEVVAFNREMESSSVVSLGATAS